MKKETKTSQDNPVKNLRELYNKNREETLQRAKENFKKIPKPKKNEQAAMTFPHQRECLVIPFVS